LSFHLRAHGTASRLDLWKFTCDRRKRRNWPKSAVQRGLDPTTWCKHVLSRCLEEGTNFVAAVNLGLEAAAPGEFVEQEEVGKKLKQILPRRCGCAGLTLPPTISTITISTILFNTSSKTILTRLPTLYAGCENPIKFPYLGRRGQIAGTDSS